MSCINKSECRKILLARAERRWPGRMKRVSQDVFDFLETSIRSDCVAFVRGHPSIGKTLQFKTHKRKKKNEMV